MRTHLVKSGVIALGFIASLAAAQPVPAHPSPEPSVADQTLLLNGVRAFRTERYAEALSIFRQVESEQQSADIGFYLGMALHKLGRHAEALIAFRAAHRRGRREPVADYYQAVSCYRLGLLERARLSFSMLIAQTRATEQTPILGPRLQLGAQRFLTGIEQAIAEATALSSPSNVLLRRYEAALQRTDELLSEKGSEAAALEWLDEAVALFMLIPERSDRVPMLRKNLARMRQAMLGKPAEADVLALFARAGIGNAL